MPLPPGAKEAIEIASKIDPNAVTQIPNSILLAWVGSGVAATFIFLSMVHLASKIIGWLQSSGIVGNVRNDTSISSPSSCTKCREGLEKQIQRNEETLKEHDKRLWDLHSAPNKASANGG